MWFLEALLSTASLGLPLNGCAESSGYLDQINPPLLSAIIILDAAFEEFIFLLESA